MSGIMLNVVGGTFAPAIPTVIGQAFGGGFYAGQIGVSSVATHYLIVGPKSSAQDQKLWSNTGTSTPGTTSDIDGPTNSNNMNNVLHPAAYFCKGLSVGGQTDWYMPATNELEVCYYNLKPTTATNSTSSGINPNAVPARASSYTSGTPAQTSAADFITSTGAEAYDALQYWASTELTATKALMMRFNNGYQATYLYKSNTLRVRAVRRIPV